MNSVNEEMKAAALTHVTKSSTAHAMRQERKVQVSAHPFAFTGLNKLTEMTDIVRIPKVGVIVSDAHMMRTILLDKTFRKTGKGSSDELWTPLLGSSGLINMDGEAHSLLRRKLGPLFSPKTVNDLSSAMMDEPLRVLKEKIGSGEPVDLSSFSLNLANLMISAIIGVDFNHVSSRGSTISETLQKVSAFTGRVGLGKKKFTSKEVDEFKLYLDDLLESAFAVWRNPDHEDDGVSVISRLKQYGLTEDEMYGVVSALIIAGTETVASVIPRLVALTVDSGWFAVIQKHPEWVPAVVDEGLRVTVPSPVMIRNVSMDVETDFGERTFSFRKDERIILANLMACNKVGPFDPSREMPEAVRRMWFGAGAHFCIGMPLALMQITRFFETLVEAVGTDTLLIESRSTQGKRLIPAYQQLVVRKVK